MANVQHKRGLRADLDALASAGGLLPGQLYVITDEERIAMALTTGTYATYSKDGDLGLLLVLDGGGQAIAAGQRVEAEVPFAATVVGWTILADAAGDAVVDVRRCAYADFPSFVSIAGTEKPTLAAQQKNQDGSLSTWTTSLAAGDLVRASVDSASTVQRLVVSLRLRRA